MNDLAQTIIRPKLPLHIDSTMRSAFVSCPQKFFLEFNRGFRPAGVSIDLHAGGCFASGLEETYKQVYVHSKNLGDALVVAHARFMQEWGDIEVPEWKRTAKTKDRVWEAIYGDGTAKGRGYFEHYGLQTDHVQPYIDASGKPTLEYTFAIPLEPYCSPENYRPNAAVGVEQEMFPEHPDGGPFIYTGRFDMLGHINGMPVVRDEKTTGSSIGQQWAEQWDLRAQFIGYVWACQQAGLNLDTVVVRAISIQKTQIVHAEAVKQYSIFIVNRWHEQLRRDLWRLRRCYDEGYWDYNLGESCTSYGNCMFMPVCSSRNPEAHLANFEVRHWNPMNKNPVTEAP
jgi:hypothetical protein